MSAVKTGGIVLVLTCVFLGGCASRAQAPPSSPVSDDGVRRAGPLTVVLESATRSGGMLEVVVVTTNSSGETQPANVDNSAPVLTDQRGDVVRWRSAETECERVEKGFLPGKICPGGCMTMTATFKDPGPGATLEYSPNEAPKVAWTIE